MEINSLQVAFILVTAGVSALLGVVAIGLWTLTFWASDRSSRRAEIAADQLESTVNQWKEYMSRSVIESIPQSVPAPVEDVSNQAVAAQETPGPVAAVSVSEDGTSSWKGRHKHNRIR